MATRTSIKRPTLALEVTRNLRRRKLRSALTLSGIALGAFALTVMGGLAENFNTSISSLRENLSEQVVVRPKGSNVFFSAGHLPSAMIAQLDAIEGVGVVVPRSVVFFEEDSGPQVGPPEAIFGVDIERALRSPIGDIRIVPGGRKLQAGDRGKIVLGSRLAQKFEVDDRFSRAGDRVEIRKKEWEIVGVGQATGTPLDGFATASIDDVREIQKQADPFLDVAQAVDEFSVYPEEGVDPDSLTEAVKAVAPETLVFPPSTSIDEINQLTAIYNAIILGSAVVALLAGGMSIIITMIFSVTERTREIGTKKAIGASSRNILTEFLSESAVLSFAGGIVGALAGFGLTKLINSASADQGVVAFTVTPRLWLFVFVLSLVIGVGAGLLPARRAARIDPVRALRTLG